MMVASTNTTMRRMMCAALTACASMQSQSFPAQQTAQQAHSHRNAQQPSAAPMALFDRLTVGFCGAEMK
jgi:hypothetical protein